MKILIIGGTGFIGRFVVADLIARGHKVAVYHRGPSTASVPAGVLHLFGDRAQIGWKRMDFIRLAPDVVVDFIASSERQSKGVVDVFKGVTPRLVMISSQDVYRAYGILLGIEEGPLPKQPITEDSDLRTRLYPYFDEQMKNMRAVFPWLDDTYEKILAERAVMDVEKLPATILRLPMVYGPGDPLHRNFPVIKRMDDGRQAILMQQDAAAWHPTRGYVENVAAAIALAIASPDAAGRIYNIAEPDAPSEAEWAQLIGDVMGWKGEIVSAPKEAIPIHLRVPFNVTQDWIVSSDRIRSELGYAEPVSRAEGLRRTVEWERANPPGNLNPALFDYAAEDKALAEFQRNAADRHLSA
ncbi:MAG: NAD-dependent epimerase/dehydratase family protein [Gemmatimonadaceae bacterium]